MTLVLKDAPSNPPPGCTVYFEYSIGTKVAIDNSELQGYVLKMSVDSEAGCEYEVGWLNNGASIQSWFPGWRLSSPKE
jgi:hypothetical protein